MGTRSLPALLTLAILFFFSSSFSVFANDAGDGMDAFKADDYETAIKIWLPLAEQGDRDAQYYLGQMYERGRGVPQDYKEAVKWYRLSSDQKVEPALLSLGFMYEKGQGVLQDYKEAAKLYRLSAEQGFAPAQSNLGVMYARGRGVPQDNVLAHMWMNLAGSNGEENAVKNRNLVEKEMSPSQIEKAQEMAREWKPTAR